MSTLPAYEDDSDYDDESRQRPSAAQARRSARFALGLSLTSTAIFLVMQVVYWTVPQVAALVGTSDPNSVLVSTVLVAAAVGLGLFGIIRSVVCISQSGISAVSGLALTLGAIGPAFAIFFMP